MNWSNVRKRFFEHKWPAILVWPLGLLYCLFARGRNLLYDIGLFRQHSLDCKVICVGNILVGGTGKTPTVLYLARWLISQGKKVAILSRGYGRTTSHRIVVADENGIHAQVDQCGDEPYLMALELKGVPIVVDRDRVAGGRFLAQHSSPDIILLDDGFQHRRLAHDFDILTFQRSSMFGNGFCLPAGPLREPKKRLGGVDLLWFNGTDKQKSDFHDYSSIPRIDAFYKVEELASNQTRYGVSNVKNQTAVAFCGLGQPENFISTLQTLEVKVLDYKVFKDHYQYKNDDVVNLEKWRNDIGAKWIITTQKDWVKLPVENLPENWSYLAISVQPIDKKQAEMILKQVFSF